MTGMSDFHNSNVGFLLLGCQILATRMSDFYNSDVGFYNSDVGFLQLGCRFFTTRMSDIKNSDVGFLQFRSRIFKLKTSMSDFQELRWHP